MRECLLLLRLLTLAREVVLENAVRAGAWDNPAVDSGLEGLLDLVRRPHGVHRNESVGYGTGSKVLQRGVWALEVDLHLKVEAKRCITSHTLTVQAQEVVVPTV
jgi:hypothetical protein